MSKTRAMIGLVHTTLATLWFLVVMTGHLTVLGFLWWALVMAAVDQAAVWGAWSLGDKGSPGPNRGWFR
jgi:hypothetical protein